MTFHPAVTPQQLRAAARQVRRRGSTASLLLLEHREPELTELLLEEVTYLHGLLIRSRLPPRQVRRLTRRIECLGLTLVFALHLASVPHRCARVITEAVGDDGRRASTCVLLPDDY